MNQDSNQTTVLLKVILVLQILMLTLFAWAYLSDSSMRTEYENQMEQYRVKEAEYDKTAAEYKKQVDEYQRQMDDYNAQLAAWQKENAAYTNGASQAPKQ